MVTRASEDDETDQLAAWFGPPSRKRNLWMFVGSTGTAGIILAIILLFNFEPPEDVEIQLAKTPSTEVVDDPFEPEPEPEPIIEQVAAVEAEPEPTPEPAVPEFEVEVILLPGPPEKNQGEQFETRSGEEIVDPNSGFNLVASDWQKSQLDNQNNLDPWAQLQKLVPLEPFGPRDYVIDAQPGGDFTASFLTTQPRRGTQDLLLPYEMTVTNRGTTPIDRLILQQTLPQSVELRETSAVHASENGTLHWEFEGLRPREQWNVPMVVVPTMQGQVKIPTTLDVGKSTSANTLIQRPDIELSLTCEPAARYKKYHQIVFLMKNTGEVPLNNLLMDIQLTGNLWHRFGPEFEFFHDQLEVGQTRRALLHVKTEELGGAQLHASLVTDEGAGASGDCEFVIVGDGNIEPRGIDPAINDIPEKDFQQPEPLREEETREWRERGGTEQPAIVPESFDDSFGRPADKPSSLETPKTAPQKQPAPLENKSVEPAVKEPSETPKTTDDFPDFPGFDEPLPERKPVPEKQPIENKPLKEDPVKKLPEKESIKKPETPAEDPFGPVDTEEEDPFAPKKDTGDFFE